MFPNWSSAGPKASAKTSPEMHKANAADERAGEVSGEFLMTEIASAREGNANRRGRLKNTNGVTHGVGDGPSDG